MDLPRDLVPRILHELADAHGTPLYVTDATTIRDRFRELRGAFPDARIHYAAKANSNPAVLALLRRLGAGLDAVSLGEVVAAERAGFEADEIMYTGCFPSDVELSGVLERGIQVNVNSRADLDRVAELAPGVTVGIRINPGAGAGHHRHVVTAGAGAKFGVPPNRVEAAYLRARELGLRPNGIHMHLGSGILAAGPFVEAVEVMAGFVRRLGDSGIALDYVDVGGGFGVPHRPGEDPLDLEALAGSMRDRLPRGPHLVVEPGRFLVAESTVLLTRVTSVKDGYVGVDAGLHTFVRPALYGAYHHVTNLSRPDAPRRRATVVGPICETGDVLARNRQLPDPVRGDLLAFHTAGAYGYSMASRYNSRPLPAEAMVDGDGSRLIRRRETLDDLFQDVTGH